MDDSPPPASADLKRSKGARVLFLVAILTLLLIYFMWWRTSFSRNLSDAQIVERLAVDIAPQEIQHAMEQLYARLNPKYEGREQFRAPLLALAVHPRFEIRRQVAWVMGRDKNEDYRRTLTSLLDDPDIGVQLNAACSLSNHGSPLGRPVLLAGLRGRELKAQVAGKLHWQIKKGDAVSLGRPAGTIEASDDQEAPISVALNGFADQIVAKEGATVAIGDVLARISPDPKNAVNILCALRTGGTSDDLAMVEGLIKGDEPRLSESREVMAAARSLLEQLRDR